MEIRRLKGIVLRNEDMLRRSGKEAICSFVVNELLKELGFELVSGDGKAVRRFGNKSSEADYEIKTEKSKYCIKVMEYGVPFEVEMSLVNSEGCGVLYTNGLRYSFYLNNCTGVPEDLIGRPVFDLHILDQEEREVIEAIETISDNAYEESALIAWFYKSMSDEFVWQKIATRHDVLALTILESSLIPVNTETTNKVISVLDKYYSGSDVRIIQEIQKENLALLKRVEELESRNRILEDDLRLARDNDEKMTSLIKQSEAMIESVRFALSKGSDAKAVIEDKQGNTEGSEDYKEASESDGEDVSSEDKFDEDEFDVAEESESNDAVDGGVEEDPWDEEDSFSSEDSSEIEEGESSGSDGLFEVEEDETSGFEGEDEFDVEGEGEESFGLEEDDEASSFDIEEDSFDVEEGEEDSGDEAIWEGDEDSGDEAIWDGDEDEETSSVEEIDVDFEEDNSTDDGDEAVWDDDEDNDDGDAAVWDEDEDEDSDSAIWDADEEESESINETDELEDTEDDEEGEVDLLIPITEREEVFRKVQSNDFEITGIEVMGEAFIFSDCEDIGESMRSIVESIVVKVGKEQKDTVVNLLKKIYVSGKNVEYRALRMPWINEMKSEFVRATGAEIGFNKNADVLDCIADANSIAKTLGISGAKVCVAFNITEAIKSEFKAYLKEGERFYSQCVESTMDKVLKIKGSSGIFVSSIKCDRWIRRVVGNKTSGELSNALIKCIDEIKGDVISIGKVSTREEAANKLASMLEGKRFSTQQLGNLLGKEKMVISSMIGEVTSKHTDVNIGGLKYYVSDLSWADFIQATIAISILYYKDKKVAFKVEVNRDLYEEIKGGGLKTNSAVEAFTVTSFNEFVGENMM
jgi:hypothetical protein